MTRRWPDISKPRGETSTSAAIGAGVGMLAGVMVLIIVGFVLAALFSVRPAKARDSEQWKDRSANIVEWFKSQHNSAGQWCCDEADGHAYDGDYSLNADGSVTVELAGKPHVIPKQMVLSGSNPTGHAVWWFIDTVAYGHVDYCFAPGSLT